MPDFLIKGKAGKTYLNDFEQYEQQLSQIADSIESIQNNLSFQVLSRAYISSQMKSLVRNVETNSQKMKAMKSSLEETIRKYNETELNIISHSLGVDISKLKGIMKSGADIITGNTNNPEDKSWMAKLFDGDFKNAINTSSIAGAGSFLGVGTAGSLTGSTLGYEADADWHGEWELDKGEFNAGVKGELVGYLAKGEAEGSWGYLSGSAAAMVGTGVVSGEAGFALFDNGKFDPGIYASGEASVSAINGEAEIKFGTEDNNIHVAGEGDVLTAEAKAGFELDSDGVHLEAEVGAAVAKGEVQGGFTLFGVTVDVAAEGEVLGVGAGASFRAEKDSFELGGKLSFLAGLGLKLKISW